MYAKKLAKNYGRKNEGIVAATTQVCLGKKHARKVGRNLARLLKKVKKNDWEELGNKKGRKVATN